MAGRTFRTGEDDTRKCTECGQDCKCCNAKKYRGRGLRSVSSFDSLHTSIERFRQISGVELDDSDLSALDLTDYRILRELSRDGRASDVHLGDRVHLSSTAAARRRKILEERRAITGYAANFDLARLGFSIVVMVSIELASQAEQVLTEFEAAVVKCPSMSYCSFVSGDTDFFMLVHVRSFEDYDRVYRSELSTLPHVARIRSSFVMREVAKRPVAPIVFNDLP